MTLCSLGLEPVAAILLFSSLHLDGVNIKVGYKNLNKQTGLL